MNKLSDLRFVIGVFFLLVGLLLITYHLLEQSKPAYSGQVNLWSGLMYAFLVLA